MKKFALLCLTAVLLSFASFAVVRTTASSGDWNNNSTWGGTIADMVPRMYKGLDPSLTGAAGRSVLAHLVDLENQGRVRCEDEAWSLAA